MMDPDRLPDAPPHVPRHPQTCFLVSCKDDPERSQTLRMEHLDAHLAHVERHWKRYVTAGPIREPGGDRLIGSVFLVLAESHEDAQALMQADPYISCGMYASVEYQELTLAIGQFIGGKIWSDAASIRQRATGSPAGGG